MRTGLIRRVVSLSVAAMMLSLVAAPTVSADTNVAPSVTATVSNANPVEPQTVVASATFTDPESATETYTCSILYGDGMAPVSGVVSDMTCTGPEHRYAATGNYAILVTVTDSGGASGDGTATVAYANDTPSVGLPWPVGKLVVGIAVHDVATIGDPGVAFETYSCTIDYGDGSPVQTATYAATSSDGVPNCFGSDHVYQAAGAYIVVATATDSGGATGSARMIWSVGSASPQVTSPADQTKSVLPSGSSFSLGSFGDPTGAAAGPWPWTVYWGDSGVDTGTATSQGPLSGWHNYQAGTYRVRVVVSNAAGWSGDAYFNVTVTANLVVGLNDPNLPATEGVPTTLNLYYYDPYPPVTAAPFAIHVDFGDGTSQNISTSSITLPIPFTHTYAAADSTPPGAPGTLYTATATVTDAQGRTGTTTLQVGVYDVAPVVTASRVVIPAGFNGQVTLASFTDASVGPWQVVIDGGPGFQLQRQVAAPGPIQIPYAAESGSRTFTVSVWDRAGLHQTVTSSVVVTSSPPVITSAHFTPSPNIEGSPVAVVATFTAPGLSGTPPETFACLVDYGDGSGQKMGTVTGDQCNGPGHLYSGLGPYTATVSVVDSLDRVGTATVGLTLPNDPPVVSSVSLPYAFEVGVPVTAHAAFSDRGSVVTSETYTCTVDYGDGGGPQPGSVIGTVCSGQSHTYSQNGDYDVKVRVADSNGGVGTGSVSIGLSNISPSITDLAFNPDPSLQGTPVSLVATFTDPGFGVTAETYTCVVYYGDGTYYDPTGTVVGNKCYGPAHVFTGMGPYTVTVYVFDSNGGGDYATIGITPLNVAAIVTPYAGIMTYGPSGIDLAAAVKFTDAGALPGETYTCTIGYGDGAGPQAGAITGSICTGPTHAYATKGTYQFVATVTDSQGAQGTYSVAIVVYNVWPSVGAVSAPASVLAGTAVTASAPYDSTGMEDPDTCTVDYGDGTGRLAAVADGATCTGPSHTYSTAGMFEITVTVTSPGGDASAAASTWIAVTSTPAVGAISVSGSLTEGSAVTASATFTPTGTQTYKCTVDYGDGAGALVGTVSGTTCKGPSHKYGRPGSFVVTVTVIGSAGNSGSSTKSLAIANVLPKITKFTVPSAAKAGSTVSVSATFTDPGTTETYQAIWTWDDGTSTTIQLGAGVRSIAASHLYSKAGAYQVHLELSDGESAFYQSFLAVYDPARTLVGSGTFASPAGSCDLTPKCGVASTATFSVSASYVKGATKPTVAFTLSVNGVKFVATATDWFIVTGGDGSIQGAGTVNGVSGYIFSLDAVDGHPDSVSVLILDRLGNRVYGTSTGLLPLKCGSITIK